MTEMAPMEVGRGDLGVAATPGGNIMVTGEPACWEVAVRRVVPLDMQHHTD